MPVLVQNPAYSMVLEAIAVKLAAWYTHTMGMVIDLGLSRFHDEPEQIIAILERLVSYGYTGSVREIIGDRVVEVNVSGTRWLTSDEVAPILRDVKACFDRLGTDYDSYSWDELDEIGAFDVQDLALPLDGPKPPPGLDRVHLGPNLELRLIDLETSIKNWPDDSIAWALHDLAILHRLIVHSA